MDFLNVALHSDRLLPMEFNKELKVAVCHDWLVNYGGAETFVELVLQIFPQAHIYTLVYDRKKMKGHFENNRIFTSSVQKIPFATRIYTKLLKFMPKAFESFDFTGYDLVICSSSSCAKGIITPPSVPHIAYIHSPMRYAWDLYFDYKKRSGKLTRHFMEKWMHEIRMWDYISSQRIDMVVANSAYIARRIKKFWNRDARVIYCPITDNRFFPADNDEKEDYYVSFSRLVAYKRVDLAVEAFARNGKKLIVIGSGGEEKKLRDMARGHKNIVFTGRISDEEVRTYLQKAKALIFCAEEDLGLTPIECQACGTPVIAYGKGGAVETVVHGKTGIHFARQTVESLMEGVEQFEKEDAKGTFIKQAMVNQAEKFSQKHFMEEFKKAIEDSFELVKVRP